MTRSALAGVVTIVFAGGVAQAQEFTNYTFEGRVISARDDLGIFPGIEIGAVAVGGFSFGDVPIGGALGAIGPFAASFDADNLAASFGEQGFESPDESGLAINNIFDPGEDTVVVLGSLDPIPSTTDGIMDVTLLGPADLFEDAQLAGGTTYVLENLTSAVVTVEFFDAAGDSSVEIEILDLASVSGGSIVTFGRIADMTGDGALNVDDVDAFVEAFVSGSLRADFVVDGVLNVDDLDRFVNRFLSSP